MTSKGRNSKGKAAIRKAQVGKDTNITMCSDLSILMEIDKEKDKEKDPPGLATRRKK